MIHLTNCLTFKRALLIFLVLLNSFLTTVKATARKFHKFLPAQNKLPKELNTASFKLKKILTYKIKSIDNAQKVKVGPSKTLSNFNTDNRKD